MSLSSAIIFSHIFDFAILLFIFCLSHLFFGLAFVLFCFWEKNQDFFSSSINVLALKPFFFSSYPRDYIYPWYIKVYHFNYSQNLLQFDHITSSCLLSCYIFISICICKPTGGPVNCIKLELLIFTYVIYLFQYSSFLHFCTSILGHCLEFPLLFSVV